MSILLRDIFVLENTVPPGVLGYRNLHTYSSFSLPKPGPVPCNHKVSQNPSCHQFKQDTTTCSEGGESYFKSQLYLSEFSCLYKLILASSIHHLLLRLTSCSYGGGKKRGFVSLFWLQHFKTKVGGFFENPDWKLQTFTERFSGNCRRICSVVAKLFYIPSYSSFEKWRVKQCNQFIFFQEITRIIQ